MKLALDTQAVVGLNGNGTRIRYRTNTDPGSSGSPVVGDWDSVGLTLVAIRNGNPVQPGCADRIDPRAHR